jgi:hypothetical protein
MDQNKHLGDARYKKIRSLIAMGGGAAVSTSNDFLWNTGGTRGGQEFVTWADLAPALAAAKGQCRIACDFSTTGQVGHITTGTWAGLHDLVFVSAGPVPVEQEIVVDEGARMPGLNRIDLDAISLQGDNLIDAGDGFTVVTGRAMVFSLRNGAELGNGGENPLVNVQDNANVSVFGNNQAIVGAHVFQHFGAGSTTSFFMSGFSSVSANAINGFPEGACNLTVDGSSALLCSSTQQGASSVSYTTNGGDGVVRVVELGTDQVTGAGPTGLEDVAGMTTGSFTPLTSQLLIRLVASVGFQTGGGAGIGNFTCTAAFSGGQSGTLDDHGSSGTADNNQVQTVVYEAMLTGLTPGIPNSVTVQAQWGIGTGGAQMLCRPISQEGQESMVLTVSDYAAP